MRLRARCVPEGQWAGLGKHHQPSPLPATKIEVCPALDRDLHRGMDVGGHGVPCSHWALPAEQSALWSPTVRPISPISRTPEHPTPLSQWLGPV